MCNFCSKWDWGEASAVVDGGKFAHIYLAIGSSRFPLHEQFMYCPVCGGLNPNYCIKEEDKHEAD